MLKVCFVASFLFFTIGHCTLTATEAQNSKQTKKKKHPKGPHGGTLITQNNLKFEYIGGRKFFVFYVYTENMVQLQAYDQIKLSNISYEIVPPKEDSVTGNLGSSTLFTKRIGDNKNQKFMLAPPEKGSFSGFVHLPKSANEYYVRIRYFYQFAYDSIRFHVNLKEKK